jgi:CDP-diacylglycerol--glycerol-3-phosphate 3-phosphatidyltransferase
VRTWVVALTYIAALSSLMVSYTKARAEGLGLECKIGFMARPERVILLAAGLILGGASWLPFTIGALALTSTATAVQRIVHVWRNLAVAPDTGRTASSRFASSSTEQQATRVSSPPRPERQEMPDARRAVPPTSQ